MSREKSEIVVGAVVLTIALFFVGYLLRGYNPQGDSYPLRASFNEADGVSIGTDVRLAGVKIGTVSNIALDPTSYKAQLTVQIQKNLEIPSDSIISIETEGLLGGTFIAVRPGGAVDVLAPGAEIENTQSAVSFISLLMKFVGGKN